MINFIRKGVMKLNSILNKEVGITPDNLKVLEMEVKDFINSQKRKEMLKAYEYYKDTQDIRHRKRTAIGKDGELIALTNLPNARITDNQYAIHIDKKNNYLLGKPFAIKSDDEKYIEILEDRMDKTFKRKLYKIGKDVLIAGVGYLYPYYKDNELKFKRFKPYEVKVYYADEEKEDVEFFFRYYIDKVYVNTKLEYVEKVDVYTLEGVKHYRFKDGHLLSDTKDETYIQTEEGQTYNWEHMPLIVFRYNQEEQMLFTRIKELQDSINLIMSNFYNNMAEDPRNTILVIHNYDGQDLAEFRQNLAEYGAVKVASSEGVQGGVEALKVEVNAENYKAILEEYRKALIKNMKSVDVDNMKSGTPNQMNIQSMFTDIDQDANNMETEFQARLDELLWFIDTDLSIKGLGDYTQTDADFEFNRDLMSDETSIINNIVRLDGLVSDETRLAQVPFVDDPKREKERMDKQEEEDKQKFDEMAGFVDEDLNGKADTRQNKSKDE